MPSLSRLLPAIAVLWLLAMKAAAGGTAICGPQDGQSCFYFA